jgi:arsenate reductase
VLRRRDKAYKALGLTGEEDTETLLHHMAEHPTLVERPIGVLGEKAVVGRPPERLLELVDGG